MNSAAASDDTRPTSAPLSGTRAERYQVLLHVTAEGTRLEDGTPLTRDTSRRLCCDSSVVSVTRDPDDGSVLDVGRRTRTIPSALRRALEVRDGGCVFPGCGLRFTDGHHLKHWADGGETSLDNLVLLCRYHHRLVHEGGWRVERWGRGAERRVVFIDPVGGIRADVGRSRPAPPDPSEPSHRAKSPDLPDRPVEALVEDNQSRGVEPTGRALWARHERAADAAWPLRARAVEALDAAHFGVG